MKMYLKILFAISILLNSYSSGAQPTAKEIFKNSTESLTIGNVEMNMSIHVTDDKGRIKEKQLSILKAEFENEGKTKVTWKKPERAKGTTIIITDIPEQTGVIEVYTPSNGKKRKLKATDANMKMMGTEFSFTQFTNFNQNSIEYDLLNDTNYNGVSCYQIKVMGSTDESSSATLVVGKNTYSIVQLTRFDKNGKAVSVSHLLDYKEVVGFENRIYPRRIVSEDLKNKKKTTIIINSIAVKKGLSDNDFKLPN